ncbi:DUF262 domain-containing protein [Turneriella parva]|uniref:GmrSD restriction endonucleases N-terminal domain-containing protein n=1 Tax=Turneriella parva (strain ATCC BAA-1111 / DSM 21527 / NCTC 11395 / H) TaxID=869212 RepID=I4B1Q7_TURPD|nr:DUF262 domain-containing protein [Turneriella parva]AFM11214.1 protein of unknown function DUF262 [Turneriella parva DSM 21527]
MKSRIPIMEWFSSNSNIDKVTISDLAVAIGEHGLVQLPSFQRDAVWNEQQIELLWDSMLRGYPVGSLIFSGTANFSRLNLTTRTLQNTSVTKAGEMRPIDSSTKYLIIDGQQRAIAVRLGHMAWVSGDKARLWIDIGTAAEAGAHRLFHVCNIKSPWGREATNYQISQAQLELAQGGSEEIFDRHNEKLLSLTWPLKAQCPVPVADFLTLYDGQKHNWHDLIPPEWPQERISQIMQLPIDRKALSEWHKRLSHFEIPIHLVREITSVEELGEAFERLNNQGTRMSQAELFFSGLKMHWPAAHDLVWQIYSDPATGRFLEPIDIVHAVVRLAAASDKQVQGDDVPELTLKDFKRLIGPSEATGSFLAKIKAYLAHEPQSEIGRFHAILRHAKAMLQYHPVENPRGLPLPALSLLSPKFWHTVVVWLDHNYEDKALISSDISKRNVLQQAIFDRLFVISTRKHRANTLAFGIAAKAIGIPFPSGLILRKYFATGIMASDFVFQTAATYAASLAKACDAKGDLFTINDIILLFWAQRESLHNWFQDYDPTLYFGSDDLPYDVDHLIAGSKFQHVRHRHPDFDWAFPHNQLHNSTGNLRIWPKHLNRADQDANLEYKGLLGERDEFFPEDDKYQAQIAYLKAKPFMLDTFGAIRAASAFAEEDVDLWREAAAMGDERNWIKKDRIGAVVKAITRRSVYLYEQIYRELEWESWGKFALKQTWFVDLSDSPIIGETDSKLMEIYVRIS